MSRVVTRTFTYTLSRLVREDVRVHARVLRKYTFVQHPHTKTNAYNQEDRSHRQASFGERPRRDGLEYSWIFPEGVWQRTASAAYAKNSAANRSQDLRVDMNPRARAGDRRRTLQNKGMINKPPQLPFSVELFVPAGAHRSFTAAGNSIIQLKSSRVLFQTMFLPCC